MDTEENGEILDSIDTLATEQKEELTLSVAEHKLFEECSKLGNVRK